MSIYIIFGTIIVIGLVRVILLLIQEQKTSGGGLKSLKPSTQPSKENTPTDILSRVGIKSDTPSKPLNKPKKSIILSLFKKRPKLANPSPKTFTPKKAKSKIDIVGFFKSKFKKTKTKELDINDIPEATTFPDLKEQLEKGATQSSTSSFQKSHESGTAGITTQNIPTPELSQEEEKKIEEEINTTAELQELRDKYARIDKLLAEKNASLEKTESQLNSEMNNRKEFNKVKDILEKELKDVKERSRETQTELNTKEAEAESYKKRVSQLEEKATNLEKEILAKEDEVDLLLKKIEIYSKMTKSEEQTSPEQSDEKAQSENSNNEAEEKKESIEEQPKTEKTTNTPPVAEDTPVQPQEDIAKTEDAPQEDSDETEKKPVPADNTPQEAVLEENKEESIPAEETQTEEPLEENKETTPIEKPSEEKAEEVVAEAPKELAVEETKENSSVEEVKTEKTPKEEEQTQQPITDTPKDEHAETPVTDIPERDETPNKEVQDNNEEQSKKDEP